MNTNTGSYIALAGLIVAVLKHFGVLVDENGMVSVLSAVAIIYGWIHQFIVTRKVVNLAKAQGIQGLK